MSHGTKKSKALFERALGVMVEGGSSPSRGPANYGDYPLFIERGSGSRIWDVDGNEYVDYSGGHGALLLGHSHPEVSAAVRQALEAGSGHAGCGDVGTTQRAA